MPSTRLLQLLWAQPGADEPLARCVKLLFLLYGLSLGLLISSQQNCKQCPFETKHAARVSKLF